MDAYWLLPRSVELEFGQRCLFRPKRLDASPLIRLMGSYSGMVTTEKIRVMVQLEILCVLDARCSRVGLIVAVTTRARALEIRRANGRRGKGIYDQYLATGL
jgi:hypothetical protein